MKLSPVSQRDLVSDNTGLLRNCLQYIAKFRFEISPEDLDESSQTYQMLMGPLDKFALRLVLLTFLLGKGKFSLLQEYQCLEVCTSESLSQPLTIPEKLIICLVQCQRTTKLVSH